MAKGFTLIEMLITIAIIVVMATFALPGFFLLVQNDRIQSATNLVVSQLNYARNAAITRNQAVNIARTGIDFSDGWEIFMDATPTGNTVFDPAEDVLIRSTIPKGNIAIATQGNHQWISFTAEGFLNEGAPIIVALCDERGEAEGRNIIINRVGRAAVSAPAQDCTP